MIRILGPFSFVRSKETILLILASSSSDVLRPVLLQTAAENTAASLNLTGVSWAVI